MKDCLGFTITGICLVAITIAFPPMFWVFLLIFGLALLNN